MMGEGRGLLLEFSVLSWSNPPRPTLRVSIFRDTANSGVAGMEAVLELQLESSLASWQGPHTSLNTKVHSDPTDHA